MPHDDEDKDTFMERCMGNEMMNDEFPDDKQRFAVCLGNWEGEEKSEKAVIESRSFNFQIEQIELRDKENAKEPIIKGHAAIFNERTSIPMWGFDEMVSRGAFIDSIKADDIRALFNHDANFVLGRNKSGTLKLQEDDRGLAIEINPPNTQFANDLMHLMERGDINQMSFAFQIKKEEWTKGEEGTADLRTLKQVKLYDISAVTFPAYEGTNIAVRSHSIWRQKNKEQIYKVKLLQRRLNLIQKEGGKLNG